MLGSRFDRYCANDWVLRDYRWVNGALIPFLKKAVARYIDERNLAIEKDPRRAGRSIWKMERVPSVFHETNNCKDPRKAALVTLAAINE